jgi:hypothetical protein
MYISVVLRIFVLFYVFFVILCILCCFTYICVVLCIFCVVLSIFVLFYVFLCCSMYISVVLRIFVLFYVFFMLFYVYFCCFTYICVVLCIVCFVTFPVLFLCICVLNYCHRVATQLQLTNISYHKTWCYIQACTAVTSHCVYETIPVPQLLVVSITYLQVESQTVAHLCPWV